MAKIENFNYENNDEIISIKRNKKWLCIDEQIGSDEVGTGDSFLPCIVVAAYVQKSDIDFINDLGIDDSKKISDSRILQIGNSVVKHFENRFSKLTLTNEKYNEMYKEKSENLNTLKAKMHNQALINLKKKNKAVSNVFVDQFCSPDKYYEYLLCEKQTLKGIIFKTKGESYYPSVAVASVIARYSLLLVKQKLENIYHMEFKLGSTADADEFGREFLARYGEEEYKKIAKLNFKNVRNILNEAIYKLV